MGLEVKGCHYKYTFKVSSITNEQKTSIDRLLQKLAVIYQIDYDEKNFEIIISLKGEKSILERVEHKLIFGISKIVKVESFDKCSRKIFLNSNFDIELSKLSLFINKDNQQISSQKPLKDIVKLLKSQKIGLIKNINGYYLCSLSTKVVLAKQIREYLNLSKDPLSILVTNSTKVKKFAILSKKEEELLNSEIKPIMYLKKKQLHRFEKVKNIPLNCTAPTNIYKIKLPKNSLEKFIANEVNIPLIFAKTHNYQDLINKVDFFISFENDILEYEDSIMQIIYGKKQIIQAGCGIAPIVINLSQKNETKYYCDESSSVAISFEDKLILAPYKMSKENFFTLYNIKENIKEIKTSSNSLYYIHTFLSGFKENIIIDFSTFEAKILYHKNNDFKIIYTFKEKPINYFNKALLKNNFIKEISFNKESQQLCDYFYEICHDDCFDYTIDDDQIDIDLTKNILKSKQCSAIVNTFVKIIKDISNKYKLPIVLCGDIFENKNLSESIIEYFIENKTTYYFSEDIPLNSSSSPLGAILSKISNDLDLN